MTAPAVSGAPRKAFAEFFAGVGLVAAGLRASGWTAAYANDIDPGKRELHSLLHGPDDAYHLADVADADAVADRIRKLPQPPLLATASFPCVDLSTAGHYRGFEGAHSSAFFAFATVLRRMGPPPLVLLENVVGFLTARGGADFAAAVATLADLGYHLDAVQLDAAWFLPQSRPRVFVVGKRADLAALWPTGLAEPHPRDPLRPPRLQQRIRDVAGRCVWNLADLPTPPVLATSLAEVLDLDHDADVWPKAAVARHAAMLSDRHQAAVAAAEAGGPPLLATAYRRMRSGQQRLEIRLDGLAGCLRTPRGGSARQIVVAADRNGLRLRWMRPTEYARLQGWDTPLPPAPTTRWLFAFGDAVCVPAIAWLDRELLAPLADRLLAANAVPPTA